MYVMIKRLSIAAFGLLLLSSCGEYYRVQKSTDVAERYSYAKKSYNEQKYGRVVSLLEDVVPSLVGTAEGPQSTYLLANSYFEQGQEADAARDQVCNASAGALGDYCRGVEALVEYLRA